MSICDIQEAFKVEEEQLFPPKDGELPVPALCGVSAAPGLQTAVITHPHAMRLAAGVEVSWGAEMWVGLQKALGPLLGPLRGHVTLMSTPATHVCLCEQAVQQQPA